MCVCCVVDHNGICQGIRLSFQPINQSFSKHLHEICAVSKHTKNYRKQFHSPATVEPLQQIQCLIDFRTDGQWGPPSKWRINHASILIHIISELDTMNSRLDDHLFYNFHHFSSFVLLLLLDFFLSFCGLPAISNCSGNHFRINKWAKRYREWFFNVVNVSIRLFVLVLDECLAHPSDALRCAVMMRNFFTYFEAA